MSYHRFTTMEKIGVIEMLIEDARAVGGAPPGSEKHVRIQIMKSIAADLRGQLEGAPSVALVEIDRRLTALDRIRRGGNFDTANPRALGALIGLMQEMVCRWPTVKLALEQLDETIKKETA